MEVGGRRGEGGGVHAGPRDSSRICILIYGRQSDENCSTLHLETLNETNVLRRVYYHFEKLLDGSWRQ